MTRKRTAAAGLLGAAGTATALIVHRLNDHPSLLPYAEAILNPEPVASSDIQVVFLGVSTLLFDDGETAFLTDGFLTRPGKLRVLLGKVAPDKNLITRALHHLDVTQLAAVTVGHSHYDHVLDAAVIAEATGAQLIGSSSTANIGRGHGLPNDRLQIVSHGESLTFGKFTLTWLTSQHCPPGWFAGTVDTPFSPPVHALRYRMGTCYSIFIEHDKRTALVQGSAGFIPGALQGRRADVVFLGIASLGRKSERFRNDLWEEVVMAVGARRVILVHWDDFWRPLDQRLVPLPRLVDDFDTSMRFLLARGTQSGVEVALPVGWEKINLFSGL